MKPVVMVLGMHRSGTSSLTGSLQQLGLYLGEVFTENPFNRKGNRENARIMDLNNAILAHNGGSWDSPPSTLTWTETHSKERDAIIHDFEAEPVAMWGFKDPRVLLTFPFWQESLPHLKLAGTFRHPAKVARSLWNRNHMPLEQGLSLWRSYNLRLLELHRDREFPIISFDTSPEEYLKSIQYVAHYLGLPATDSAGSGETFFDHSLRQEHSEVELELPSEVIAVYDQLNELTKRLNI